MRIALLLVTMCVGLLFAATTAPPGYGLSPQTVPINDYANHDIGTGYAAVRAPEVRPGNTNPGTDLLNFALIAFSLAGLGAGILTSYTNRSGRRPTNAQGRGALFGVGKEAAPAY